MRAIMGKIIKIIIVLVFCVFIPADHPYSSDINPSIETISTGPFNTDKRAPRYRFRIITVFSEVSYSVHFEQIEYGDENCCLKVIKSFTIEPSLIEGEYRLFSVSNIKWLSYNSVRFKGNSASYTIRNLDSKYIVIKE
jgi:hypothetical protein